ncbi:transposase family protein [Mucilaginibacter sp. 21P]|uniref:integrase core domain-containing protein n=1 Tax=Mucilaginibacter sp. 21P TaxID=2778902 RepID=UPI001C56D5F4|nr:integrase core domain-containing protein [Mucilaginibacter sp. 21P]QXV65233.1 transposase family protein [Mucilaginibacter sp. 21P]QXV65437.1 transposase family protein [Mucilaginibacter sp. 21P]
MRNINNDLTLKRNYLSKYRFLISEYEQVKRREHPVYRFARDFYLAHDTDARAFLKYYNLFKQSGNELDLLPQKRGPKYGSRRPSPVEEQQVLELRDKGCNKFEINSQLRQKSDTFTPSPSGIYNILKRNGRNRLKPVDREIKQKIVKERMGQLGHIDCHHLSKSVIRGQNRKLYLLCVLDDYSRLAWAQVMTDITALTTMFTAMHCMQALKREFGIQMEEIIADNGPEFGTAVSQNKMNHPFERMLVETGIKRRYMKPYRPQTNGKVERFWRTLKEDLIEDTDFDSLQELEDELLKYLVYYNWERPHQGIGGKKPIDMATLNNKK